jgi:uncharacterized protein YcfJ
MNKSALIGTVFGIALATTVAGVAGYSYLDKGGSPGSAAAQDCHETQVERQVAAKDDRRIAGTVIGAVIGGAVGNDVGDRNVTTAAGAAIGAIAGNQAQKKLQENRTVTTTEVQCVPAKP